MAHNEVHQANTRRDKVPSVLETVGVKKKHPIRLGQDEKCIQELGAGFKEKQIIWNEQSAIIRLEEVTEIRKKYVS